MITEETGQKILGELFAIRRLLEHSAANDPATLERAKHSCPLCSGQMKVRTNRTDGAKFFGCIDFPNCKGTRDIYGIDTKKAAREDQPAPRAESQPWKRQDPPLPAPPRREAPGERGGSGFGGYDDDFEDDQIPF